MQLRSLAGLCAGVATSLAIASTAHAAVFVVDALANSSSGGVGLATLALTAGETLIISSSTDDLWSAGALPRYSDANGLTGDRFATASDDSGRPVGSQIGANFGLWPQFGISAPYGSLVGELGGVFHLLGANTTTTAWNTGTLHLYYWDSNNGDNFGNIRFDITAGGGVPEAATWTLMIAGFGGAGAMLRRKRSTAAA